ASHPAHGQGPQWKPTERFVETLVCPYSMRRDAALFQHPNPVRLAIGDVNRAGGTDEDAVRAGEAALARFTIRPIAPLPRADYGRDDPRPRVYPPDGMALGV